MAHSEGREVLCVYGPKTLIGSNGRSKKQNFEGIDPAFVL